MEWAKFILSNLTGIAAIIALVISLVKYVMSTEQSKKPCGARHRSSFVI